MDYTRSNYAQDRSSDFKHQVSSDISLPTAMTVQDYIHNEKSKQMNKLRDWHLESKNGEQVDSVRLRSNLKNSRNYTVPSPVQELDHHKNFLIGGIVLATMFGGWFFFVH